jgi:hypothetical protein
VRRLANDDEYDVEVGAGADGSGEGGGEESGKTGDSMGLLDE